MTTNSQPEVVVVVTGLFGCGKTTLGSTLARTFGYVHYEMSDYAKARMNAAGGGSLLDGLESFCDNDLWPAFGDAVIAEDVVAAIRRAQDHYVVITGPRRAQEVDVLAAQGWRLTHVHLETSWETRVARRIEWPSGSHVEAIADFNRREAAELRWGVSEFSARLGVKVIGNNGPLDDAVQEIRHLVAETASADGPVYEAEVRLSFTDPESIRDWLASYGWVRDPDVERVADTYFLPIAIQSLDDHEDWLRSGNCAPLRLRTVRRAGQARVWLEVKAPKLSDLSVNREVQLAVMGVAPGTAFLEALGYWPVATLTKYREHWRSTSAPDACVDLYDDGLGVLEFEILASSEAVASGARGTLNILASRTRCEKLTDSPALERVRKALRR